MTSFGIIMNALLKLIETGDVCGLFLLIAFFAAIGHLAVQSHPKLHAWGLRLAFLAFVGYLLCAVARDGLSDTADLAAHAFRGTLAAGLTLGLSWCGLAFVHLIHQAIFAPILRRVHRFRRECHASRRRRRECRQREQEQRLADEEWQRTAPARERAQRKCERREAAAAENRAGEQARRERVRFNVQVLYDRYRAELREKLPEEAFQAYFAQYLTDAHPAAEVEARGEALQQMILDRLKLAGKQRFDSIEQIVVHFREQKTKLQNLGLDPDTEETLRIDFDDAEQTAIREFLKSTQ